MRNLKKLLGFMVVLMVVITSLCSVSFADDIQYSENLIPTMTSNTAPSGIVSASDSWSNTPAWKAFDKVNVYSMYASGTYNYYAWGTQKTYGWLAYEFTTPQVITKYTLAAYTRYNNNPKNWTFEAWDGTQWIVLDTQKNITSWTTAKKEFDFSNSVAYLKYRINVSSSTGSSNTVNLAIVELEMIGSPAPQIPAPTNLTAEADSNKVTLTWDSVEGATSYNIKRGTISGQYDTIIPLTPTTTDQAITFEDTGLTNGTTYYYVVSTIVNGIEGPNSIEVAATPMQVIPLPPTNLIAEAGNKTVKLVWNPVENATGYNVKRATTPDGEFQTIALNLPSNSFIDSGLENDTTYYYVVSVIVSGVESPDSNVAPATPFAPVIVGNNAILEITMLNGAIKEYDLTAGEIRDFLMWYDSRSDGIGTAYYIFTNKGIVSPFLNKSEFIPFDKILYFEVKEYAS